MVSGAPGLKRAPTVTGMPCVGLDWFVQFLFASNRTGPVHFQTCIGLNRIDPGAALLYYVLVPVYTSSVFVPVCTGYITYQFVPDVSLYYGAPWPKGPGPLAQGPGPLGPGAWAPWPRGPGPLAQGPVGSSGQGGTKRNNNKTSQVLI